MPHHLHPPRPMRQALRPDQVFARIAGRLRKLPAGDAGMDGMLQRAFGLVGGTPAYTSDEAALRTLLPEGAEMSATTEADGKVWGVVRCVGPWDSAEYRQEGATSVLAMAGALMRAHAAWTRAKG